MNKPGPAMRALLTALHEPDPRIYWVDLLGSATVGWGSFFVGYRLRATPWCPLLLVVSALALLRAVYFVHELAHVSPKRLPGFSVAWHVVAGIPLGIPALMVGAHRQHHLTNTYGTARDPEYVPYAHWPRWRLALEVVSTLLAPPLLFLRWGLIAPLSFVIPPLRRLAITHLSTLGNPLFARDAPTPPERRGWIAQELIAMSWVWALVALTGMHRLPLVLLAWAWAVMGTAFVLNHVRTLVAHAYENEHGERLSVDGQLLDTLTLGGGLLTELIAPLGDRYHAAHHRFPSMPYHNLGKAHRLLLDDAELGAKYRSTQRRGVMGALARLLTRSAPSLESIAGRALGVNGAVPVERVPRTASHGGEP